MKIIHLMLSRFHQYWANSREVFIMFLVGGTLSSVVFTYSYGNLAQFMTMANSQDYQYRRYSVCGSEDYSVALDKDTVMKIAQHELIADFALSTYTEDVVGSGRQFVTLRSSPADFPILTMLQGHKDLAAVPNGLIMPLESELLGTVGETILVEGVAFEIIGLSTGNCAVIRYEIYEQMNLPIHEVVYAAKVRQDYDNDPVKALLENAFPNAYIIYPYSKETFDLYYGLDALTPMCLAYFVAMASFMFLLRYLMDSMRRSTVVTMIVGGSKGKIFALSVLESLSLCALVDGAGIGIHWLLFPSFFSKLSLNDTLIYTPTDYLVIFLVMMGVGLLVTIPFVIKYARLTPATAIRRAD